MPVLTKRLALVVALAGIALAAVPGRGWDRWLAANVVLALVAVADAVAAVAPARIGLERRLPAGVALGQAASISWRVTNGGRRRADVHLADSLPPSLRADDRRAKVRLDPGAAATITVGIRPARRGAIELDALVVRSVGPLGLAGRQRRRSLPAVLRVVPPFPSRATVEARIERGLALLAGSRTAGGLGGGTEFEQLRAYTPDDESRSIDWAATARTGAAIVRTYRPERHQQVVVMLDSGRLMAGRVAGVPRLEHAIDATFALTMLATRLGDRAGVVAFGSTIRGTVAPSTRPTQLAAVTDLTFELQPELTESDYRGACSHVVTRFRRRSLLVVLTDLAEAPVEEALVPALPILTTRHVVIVAAVADPAVEAWANGPADDADTAYRRAAAVAALDQRHRAVKRLNGLGARVIDGPPGALAATLCDAYLTIKATGAL